MKAYIVLFLMVLLTNLFSIGVIDVENPVNTLPERNGGVIEYHNGIDEQHWYGTDRWAVNFVPGDFYSSVDSAGFDTDGVAIYLWNPQNSISFKLYKTIIDDDSLLTELSYTFQAGDNSGWYEFDFTDDMDALTNLWLVIDYHTAEDGPYMSANQGDGSRCFYWEALSETEGYFRNNAGSGLSSDFLIGLTGHFTFASSNDIALLDFGITGRIYPDGEVQAYYTIRNNNPLAVNDVNINYTLTPAPSSGLSSLSLTLNDLSFSAYETRTDTASFENSFMLPSMSGQYQILANLTSESDDILSNNSISKAVNVFLTPVENNVVENFLNSGETYVRPILNSELLLTDDYFVLNYFPEQSDVRFFRTSSGIRNNYYNNFGLPGIILQGDNVMAGYDNESDFIDDYYAMSQTLESDKTFILGNGYMVGMDASENIYIDTYLQLIENTYLFSQFYTDCSFHAAVFQSNVPYAAGSDDIVPGMVLLKSLTSIDGVNLQAFSDSTEAYFAVDFSQYDLEIIDDIEFDDALDDLHFVYWIQDSESQQIFLIESETLEYLLDGVSASVKDEDTKLPAPSIAIYPNPVRSNGAQNISFSMKSQCDKVELEIYNIKGQRVRKLVNNDKQRNYNFIWNLKDNKNKDVSSGVYLYRFKVETKGKTQTFHNKSILLK